MKTSEKLLREARGIDHYARTFEENGENSLAAKLRAEAADYRRRAEALQAEEGGQE